MNPPKTFLISPVNPAPARPFSLFKKGFVVLALVVGTFFSPETSNAAITSFKPGETVYTNDLSAFIGSKTGKDIGWGGAAPQDFIGAAPRGSGYQGNIVIEGIGTERSSTLNASTITLPTFSAGEKIFFSSSFYSTTSASSGGRILFRTQDVTFVGGFGLLDLSASQFLLQTANGINYSTEKYISTHWYELALVIEIHETDISLSIGSLFVRDLTLGETNFRLVEGLSNINMGYTAEQNLNNFSYFRFEGFRTNAQIGEIKAGYALEAIPEPTAATLGGMVLLVGGAFLLRNKRAFRLF